MSPFFLVGSYPKEESNSKMEEAYESEEKEGCKYSPHDAAHSYLLLVTDEGSGYDVGQQQQVHEHIKHEISHRGLVLGQKSLSFQLRGTVQQLAKETETCYTNSLGCSISITALFSKPTHLSPKTDEQ